MKHRKNKQLYYIDKCEAEYEEWYKNIIDEKYIRNNIYRGNTRFNVTLGGIDFYINF